MRPLLSLVFLGLLVRVGFGGGEVGLSLSGEPGLVPQGKGWIKLTGTWIGARLEVPLPGWLPFRSLSFSLELRGEGWRAVGGWVLGPAGLDSLRLGGSFSPEVPPIGATSFSLEAGADLLLKRPLSAPTPYLNGWGRLGVRSSGLWARLSVDADLLSSSPARKELSLGWDWDRGRASIRSAFLDGWAGSTLELSLGRGEVSLTVDLLLSPAAPPSGYLALSYGGDLWGLRARLSSSGSRLTSLGLSLSAEVRGALLTLDVGLDPGLLPTDFALRLARSF